MAWKNQLLILAVPKVNTYRTICMLNDYSQLNLFLIKEIFGELLPVSSLTFKQIEVFFLLQGSEILFTQSMYVK